MTPRDVGRRGEHLLAVDDPIVAVAGGATLEHVGIRTALGLGHRITGGDLAVEMRGEIHLLLLVGTGVGDDLGVARAQRQVLNHFARHPELAGIRTRDLAIYYE